MLKSIRSNKGFSLVELMIVVAIIGILASVAIPNFQRFQRKARQSEAKNMLSAYYTAEKSFAAEYNQYAGNFYAAGFKPDGKLGYRVVTTINATAAPNSIWNNMGIAVTPLMASCVTTNPAVCPSSTTPTATAQSTNDWLENAASNNVGIMPAPTAAPAATGALFGATAGGFIGTTQADQWTIDQKMDMVNLVSGI